MRTTTTTTINTGLITYVYRTMSPERSAHVAALLDGDRSVTTLDGARREIAAHSDRMVHRNRGAVHCAARVHLIRAAQEAYDQIAAEISDL